MTPTQFYNRLRGMSFISVDTGGIIRTNEYLCPIIAVAVKGGVSKSFIESAVISEDVKDYCELNWQAVKFGAEMGLSTKIVVAIITASDRPCLAFSKAMRQDLTGMQKLDAARSLGWRYALEKLTKGNQ